MDRKYYTEQGKAPNFLGEATVCSKGQVEYNVAKSNCAALVCTRTLIILFCIKIMVVQTLVFYSKISFIHSNSCPVGKQM